MRKVINPSYYHFSVLEFLVLCGSVLIVWFWCMMPCLFFYDHTPSLEGVSTVYGVLVSHHSLCLLHGFITGKCYWGFEIGCPKNLKPADTCKITFSLWLQEVQSKLVLYFVQHGHHMQKKLEISAGCEWIWTFHRQPTWNTQYVGHGALCCVTVLDWLDCSSGTGTLNNVLIVAGFMKSNWSILGKINS